MKGSHGKLNFSENERGEFMKDCIKRIMKDYMERITNEENDWDHNVKGDAVEGAVVCVNRGCASIIK